MRTAVITAVRGRGAHLYRQLKGLARSTRRPDLHVIVAMNDRAAAHVATECGIHVHIVDFPSSSGALPIAAARNAGAQTAIDSGAELLVFLDVDCIPAPMMIDRYHRAAQHGAHHCALLCGPVTYLGPPPPGGYDLHMLETKVAPHSERPWPADDQILISTDYHLFWSLSFALTKATWSLIGGFSNCYTGYGGEDTDFGQLAAEAGVTMRWVGGAHAFHQHHPISDPPVEHMKDILLNANIFHQRWGWWPMRGWLDEFVARGLVRWDATGAPAVNHPR
jgi:GT2 family glycosyltransferase